MIDIDTAKNVLPLDAVGHAKDVAQDTFEEIVERFDLPITTRRTKRRSRSKLFIFLTLIGFAALAIYLARRRGSNNNDQDFAPDPFGRAVEESQQQSFGRPIATPGA